MGRVDFRQGLEQPAMRTVLDLLKDERWWIMFSGEERHSAGDYPWDDSVPFARAFVEAAPDRVIWATDWPHVRFAAPCRTMPIFSKCSIVTCRTPPCARKSWSIIRHGFMASMRHKRQSRTMWEDAMRPQAGLAVALTTLALMAPPASAQNWPSHFITLVVAVSRRRADRPDRARGRLGPRRKARQQVVVENRSGAGGNVGAASVAKAPADGYTLLLATTFVVNNRFMYKNLAYDTDRDFAPIALISKTPIILVAKAIRAERSATWSRPRPIRASSISAVPARHRRADHL